MAATKKNQQAAAAPVVDPEFEWAEKAGSFVLRLALPGFRKADFRVQVDGAGRLTVSGSRPAASAGQGSFTKVFQLPASATLDDIAGRFEAGVLTLTVPKRASSSAPAPTSIDEINRTQPSPSVAKEEGAGVKKAEAKEEIGKEEALKKAMDEATKKAPQQKQHQEQAKSSKREPASAPANKEDDVKPKAPQAAAAAPPPPKPEAVAGGDKSKAAVAPGSPAERVRRRGEEENADAAPMAAAAKRAKTDREENRATAACGGWNWKERVQGELKVLTDMKWADGVVEAARRNKEVLAVGVAAFSLGFLVSNKLLRK